MIFLPDMIKRKRGHFLSVSSTMGYVGICHQSDYVATKHALVGMNESVSVLDQGKQEDKSSQVAIFCAAAVLRDEQDVQDALCPHFYCHDWSHRDR